MKEFFSIIFSLFVLIAGSGCRVGYAQEADKPQAKAEKSSPINKDKVVAEAQGVKITVGMVEERIKSSLQPSIYKDREKLKELINSMVDQELMVQEAKRGGLDKLPRVREGVKRNLYTLMQTKFIEKNLSMDSISEDEVRKYYDEHKSEYNQPSMVRASHILVTDESKARELLEKAKVKGFDLRKFRQLATENSEDEATRKKGGDLRYFSIDGKVWYSDERIDPIIAEAAFSLKVYLKAQVIVMDDEKKANEILKEAVSKRVDEAGFRRLVRTYSVEGDTKRKGGQTAWFDIEGKGKEGESVLPERVAGAMFSFQTPGTIVPRVLNADGKFYIVRIKERDDPGNLYPDLIKTDRGYHILWIVNRRPAVHKTLKDVEYSIKQRLWQEKKKKFIDELVEKLMRKYNVKVYEQNLNKVVVDLSGVPESLRQKYK